MPEIRHVGGNHGKQKYPDMRVEGAIDRGGRAFIPSADLLMILHNTPDFAVASPNASAARSGFSIGSNNTAFVNSLNH